jgi:hypothetical protein
MPVAKIVTSSAQILAHRAMARLARVSVCFALDTLHYSTQNHSQTRVRAVAGNFSPAAASEKGRTSEE